MSLFWHISCRNPTMWDTICLRIKTFRRLPNQHKHTCIMLIPNLSVEVWFALTSMSECAYQPDLYSFGKNVYQQESVYLCLRIPANHICCRGSKTVSLSEQSVRFFFFSFVGSFFREHFHHLTKIKLILSRWKMYLNMLELHIIYLPRH